MENQNEKTKEIRNIPDDLAEVRLKDDSRNIEGYGIVFNSLSQDLGGFKEVILPGAIDGVIEKSDIFGTINHDIYKGILARSENGKGSLKLSVDQKGVKYSFEAPGYDLGDEVVEGVKRGDLKRSSFSFRVEDEVWEKKPDGSHLRTIKKFQEIFDMGPVYRAAYNDTAIAMRSLDNFKAAEKTEDVKPDPAKTVSEPLTKKLSRDERYLRHLNKLLKIKNEK